MLVSAEMKPQGMLLPDTKEHIRACSDRTLYAAGEKVYFSLILFNDNDSVDGELSRVAYCELVSPSGNRITGGKYLLGNSAGSGSLLIPEDAPTGIYYLKFYTRFMRNYPVSGYTFIMLKIVNPSRTEIIAGTDTIDNPSAPGNIADNEAFSRKIEISTSKKSYSPGEVVTVDIKVNAGEEAPVRLCLSVIPAATFTEHVVRLKKNTDTVSSVFYSPETRGVSLSGQLIAKETRQPLKGVKVNLSIVGDRDILVVRTDSAGRFFFALPAYYGKRDIFLCADDLPDITPELLIDNDFCARPLSLPSPTFSLNDEETKAAYKLVVNARINAVYTLDTNAVDATGTTHVTSFYGKPTEVLVMDKYIDLPTLGEYFTDLPGLVKLKKVHGRRQFRFYDAQESLSMYEPLMLIDWVAVNNIEKILAMSPAEIDRIEFVNAPYVKGNIKYGGIISFVSKKNDFAGIDLPTSGTFVNYKFLEEINENSSSLPSFDNIPDARNTVLWEPDLTIPNNGITSVSFKVPVTIGKLTMIFYRFPKTGKIISAEQTIEVTAKP